MSNAEVKRQQQHCCHITFFNALYILGKIHTLEKMKIPKIKFFIDQISNAKTITYHVKSF